MSEIRGLGGGDHDGAASGSADLMGSSAAEDGAVFTGSHNGSSSSSSRPPIARGVNARPNSPLRVNAYGAATGERGVNARPSTPQRYAAEAEATTSIVGFYSGNSDQDRYLYLGPELKQENRGETKHLLFGGCFAWHSK